MTDAGKYAEKGEPPIFLVGMQAGAATLESSMEVLQKVENRATLQPSNCTTGIYPKDTDVVKRHVHPNVHSSNVHVAKFWKKP